MPTRIKRSCLFFNIQNWRYVFPRKEIRRGVKSGAIIKNTCVEASKFKMCAGGIKKKWGKLCTEIRGGRKGGKYFRKARIFNKKREPRRFLLEHGKA